MCDKEILAVRKVRHEISKECEHDVHKVAAYYRTIGKQLRQAEKRYSKDTSNPKSPRRKVKQK